MFGKLLSKTDAVATETSPAMASPASASAGDARREEAVQKAVTVIASEAEFTGNIVARGDVHVRGVVSGNITVEDGCVKLMRTGRVEGDVRAPQIVLDGTLRGRCIADAVEILEHGRLDGIVQSSHFSIRTGGAFIGQAEAAQEPPASSPVVHDVAQADRDDAAFGEPAVYGAAV
jgi:cytoskeletal protein CcmA (bactofilin family)